MSDEFRAEDLTEEHLGQYVRTRRHEGYLRAIGGSDSTGVQLLLIDGNGPFLPVVPHGEPVEVTPDPP